MAVLLASINLLPVPTVAQDRFYKRATCKDPSPESVEAWTGCWKLGPAQQLPTEENLFVRMKFTEQEAKQWWESDEPSSGDYRRLSNPHYCTVDGRHTLAERDVDFRRYYTGVYEMHDEPIEEWERLVQARHIGGNPEPAQFLKVAKEFIERGGKYIRTWIVMKGRAGWDDDAEEDMWALPVPCEEIEREQPNEEGSREPPAG